MGVGVFHDIVFAEHTSGIIFCDFEKGAICLNSKVTPQHQGMGFFVDNIHECIGHETLHLLINDLEGERASHLMHNLDCFGDLRRLPYSWFSQKTRKCNKCHEKEGIHRWGKCWLCDGCHERHLKKCRNKSKNVTIKLFGFRDLCTVGEYVHGKSEIRLYGFVGWLKEGFEGLIEDRIEDTLSHEIMHHVLNGFIDSPTSFDYDNISSYVDSNHSLRIRVIK